MRPIHLEITGFGPFRQKTEIDLSDIELVALVGRTGSGKSTVIDAITFALFGGISRYGKGKLFPAINQMSNEALVALTFQIGERSYQVVRKLVRTSNYGATTKEARLLLEDRSEIIGVDDIDKEISTLLGLDFVQFNKAVFLPQGKFAEFLHESPTKRQRILRGILDLGIYEKVRNLSNHRAATAGTEIKILESRLEEISGITDDVVSSLTSRSKSLNKLKSTVKLQLDSIRSQTDELLALKQEHAKSVNQLEALDTIEKPKDLDSLASSRYRATIELDRLQQRYDELNKDLRRIEKTMESLTKPAQLLPIIDNHKKLTEVNASILEKNRACAQQQKQLAIIDEKWLQANEKKNKTTLSYDTLLSKSKVSAFVKDLVIGEPCPLCLTEVMSIPEHNHDAALLEAKKRRDEATAASEASFEKKTATKIDLDGLTQVIATLTRDQQTLQYSLDGATTLRESEAQLALYEKTNRSRDALTKDLQVQHQKIKRARTTLEELQKQETTHRSVFDRSRDTLNRLGLSPPQGSSDSIVVNWNDLLRWRAETKANLTTKISQNDESQKKMDTAIEQQRNSLLTLLQEEEIPYEDSFDEVGLSSWVERAHTKIGHELDDAKKALKRKKESLAKLKRQTGLFKTYTSLSKNLESRRFEAWLMQEVLEELAEGATKHLFALSSGAYSLELNKKEFVVRDHHNADEIRVAESLSGGETFLASLSPGFVLIR